MDQTSDIAAAARFELVGPSHADALADLFERNAAAALQEMFDPFPLTAEQARMIAHRGGNDLYYGATSVGGAAYRLVALSMLRGFDEGYEVPSFGIFVDSASRHGGIGRRLTAWTIEQAWRLRCSAVRLSVYADNRTARRIYESLGFRETERNLVRRGRQNVEKIVMIIERDA